MPTTWLGTSPASARRCRRAARIRWERARTILERLSQANPRSTRFLDGLSKAYNNLGRFQDAKGLRPAGLASFRRAIAIFEALPHRTPTDDYNFACNLALAVPLVGDRAHPTPTDQLERRALADRALAALRRAAAGGFSAIEIYRGDSDLDSLRPLTEFQNFLLDMAMPADPFARIRPR